MNDEIILFFTQPVYKILSGNVNKIILFFHEIIPCFHTQIIIQICYNYSIGSASYILGISISLVSIH